MGLQTGAGSAIAICVAAPVTQDAAGYAALSFTEAEAERQRRLWLAAAAVRA